MDQAQHWLAKCICVRPMQIARRKRSRGHLTRQLRSGGGCRGDERRVRSGCRREENRNAYDIVCTSRQVRYDEPQRCSLTPDPHPAGWSPAICSLSLACVDCCATTTCRRLQSVDKMCDILFRGCRQTTSSCGFCDRREGAAALQHTAPDLLTRTP